MHQAALALMYHHKHLRRCLTSSRSRVIRLYAAQRKRHIATQCTWTNLRDWVQHAISKRNAEVRLLSRLKRSIRRSSILDAGLLVTGPRLSFLAILTR